mmetsp:Transcript_10700/g.13232  ORF Transcript_10700/g.13232 Transcript_10700/m.13232 type:complete len:89 (+) Transcript_10700:102-368(+)
MTENETRKNANTRRSGVNILKINAGNSNNMASVQHVRFMTRSRNVTFGMLMVLFRLPVFTPPVLAAGMTRGSVSVAQVVPALPAVVVP